MINVEFTQKQYDYVCALLANSTRCSDSVFEEVRHLFPHHKCHATPYEFSVEHIVFGPSGESSELKQGSECVTVLSHPVYDREVT